MDRRTRAFIVVGLAAVLATGAAYGVYRAIQTRPVERIAIAARFVVVAKAPIPVGTMITPDMVRVAGWPADAPIGGNFEKPEDVIGRGVTAALVENEPVIESKLAPKGTGAGLAPAIPPGMRAIAVRVNDVISVAGYTLAGSHVDVIVTFRPTGEPISRIVISNALVLSSGGNTDTVQAREGKPVVAPLVTLALSPIDAERLTLATTQGQVTLALRNPMDTEQVTTAGARMAGLLGAPVAEPPRPSTGRPRAAAPAPAPQPAPQPARAGIEIFAGNQRKEQIIKK